MSTPDAPAPSEVAEIERAFHRLAYLSTRASVRAADGAGGSAAGPGRRRAAAADGGHRADAAGGAGRPAGSGGLARHPHGAAAAEVRPCHPGPGDPDDRRAQRIELTGSGREAIARIRETGIRGMRAALADWSPDDLRQLATLFHRMVDDFLAHAAEEPEPAHDA